MNKLEVPEAFSRARIQRDQTIGKEVCSDPVRAIVVIGCRTRWEIRRTALFINRNLTPSVHSANVFPCVLRPRVIPVVARVGNSVKRPDEFPGSNIKSPQVSGSGKVAFACC